MTLDDLRAANRAEWERIKAEAAAKERADRKKERESRKRIAECGGVFRANTEAMLALAEIKRQKARNAL